jgi:nitrate/TMAO reductase-like tetraheme cytochrome c subunit
VKSSIDLLGYVALACILLAAAMQIYFLVRDPPFNLRVKLRLLFGLGALPALAVVASTATGMETTTERQFCGSCHVMDPYVDDSTDPHSQSLAARHARNPFFGDRNCYTCHADYGMLGYPMTKLNGLRHMYEYYIVGWNRLDIPEALAKIHLRKPYDNTNCRQCHTGTLEDWGRVSEHVSLAAELRDNRVSCASAGCHGYAHPFSQNKQGDAPEELQRKPGTKGQRR